MDKLHVWEMNEIRLQAKQTYENPYRDVDVWVNLKGPGFNKKVYGFWNGGDLFIVRWTATAEGSWTWISECSTGDSGLTGKSGHAEAVSWTREELDANPNRRGILGASKNGRTFEYADGTPFFLLGDTWWATPTSRYPWKEGEHPIGPDMSFQDMVRFRKEQGFNSIAILAGFPHWGNDGKPSTLRLEDEDKTPLRQAWMNLATGSSKDMENEGGRPFLFPGKVPGYEEVVPDLDRINPDYFSAMDRKIEFLAEQGFVPFIEVSRRDIGPIWKKFYDWPVSYTRYIQYIFSRYQAQNCLLSPIHFDYPGFTIPAREYNAPANLVIEKYGAPPFGNLLSANASPSTLTNFGSADEAPWLTFHQTGNWREHEHYWYLTEIFNSEPARPALNGEPYYPGFPDNYPPAHGEEANLNFRSGMYGSFLSGGFAGYIYGAEGLWGGDIEPEARYRTWDAIKFESGTQVRHLKTFAEIGGEKSRNLIPDPDLIVPNKTGPGNGYRGWAFCSRDQKKEFVLGFLEKDCPSIVVRGLLSTATYALKWFNPRNGAWRGDYREVTVDTDQHGRLKMPVVPSDTDWGFALIFVKNNQQE